MNKIIITCFIFIYGPLIVCGGRLWPYGFGLTDDRVLTRYTKGSKVSYRDQVKAVRFQLKKEVDIFGKKTSQLKIYENGVVSRNIHSHINRCPEGFNYGSYLMAFWTVTDINRDGRVFYRQEVQGYAGQRNTIDFNVLANEISRGAEEIKGHDFYTGANGKSTLKGSDIESAIVITWHDMAQPYSIFSDPSHRNTFQMVIASTGRGSYMHLVYERVDYFQFHTYSFYCHNAAIAGITEGKYGFQLTSFFYLTPSSLRLHSNIADFSQLGRYVLVLKKNIPQPSPPRLNCYGENPDPYCKTGLPPNFCQYRPTGRYPHPSFCDKFVLCNGRRTDVQQCKGLVYNPWIETCDWKHNYQCVSASIGIESMFLDLERTGRSQTLFSIRYNTINLDYGIHNNTCVGVPAWGNTIDISSCDHYLMCSNSRTYRIPCPPSFDGSKLYFNPDKNYCDFKRNVECKNGIRPSDRPKNDTRPVIITPPPIITRSTRLTSTIALPASMNPCKRRGNLNSVDPLSCDHYYTCLGSKILNLVRCPLSWNGKTLFYDVDTNQCRYRNDVECNESNIKLNIKTTKKTTTKTTTKVSTSTTGTITKASTTILEPESTSPDRGHEENKPTSSAKFDGTTDTIMDGKKSERTIKNNVETTATKTSTTKPMPIANPQ